LGRFEKRNRMAQLPPNYSPPAGMDPPIPGPYPPCTNDPHSAQLTQVDDPNQIVDGWPKLARLISDNPGFEAFPSFKDLNIKMLLYYQAELHLLKEKLRKRECDDCIESERRQNNFCSANVYNNRFEHLLSLKELDKNNPDREQYNLVMEMRLLLEKYSLFPSIFLHVALLTRMLDRQCLDSILPNHSTSESRASQRHSIEEMDQRTSRSLQNLRCRVKDLG